MAVYQVLESLRVRFARTSVVPPAVTVWHITQEHQNDLGQMWLPMLVPRASCS